MLVRQLYMHYLAQSKSHLPATSKTSKLCSDSLLSGQFFHDVVCEAQKMQLYVVCIYCLHLCNVFI